MGLFTGFSVISGIELIYWIWFKVTFKDSFLLISIRFSSQVVFHKKDQVAPVNEPEAPPPTPQPPCCSACENSVPATKMQEVEKELQDQQITLESQKSTLENQQKEIEELKLAVRMNTFSEAGRVFDTVFKPPPTIAEEAEEEVKEETTSNEVSLAK